MIDKRTLEFILADQREEIMSRARETLCSRKEEALVELSSPQAQVVIGLRRCGKSTLCYQALQNSKVKYAYADFDDERLANLTSEQLNDVLEVLYMVYGNFSHLFLDEIQNVEGWPLFVNRLLRKKMGVVISGSNSKLLSGELATHLSGRSKEIDLFPFSFMEYCTMKGVDIDSRTTKAEAYRRTAFDEYMLQGGLPEMLLIHDNKKYVKNLVDNILKRDIEQRYKVSYKAAFENMAQHMLNNAPTIVVGTSLAKTFQFKSSHTAKNYVDYLKQAFLIISIRKYSHKSRIRLSQEKVYAADVAMMNYRENAFAGENLGHRLETMVLNHLVRKCKIDGMDIYYLNESAGECDFLVCHGNKVVQAIQVSYDISSPKTRKREFNGLLLAAKLTGCNNLLLLTDHESASTSLSGRTITIQPVYEWCLQQGI